MYTSVYSIYSAEAFNNINIIYCALSRLGPAGENGTHLSWSTNLIIVPFRNVLFKEASLSEQRGVSTNYTNYTALKLQSEGPGPGTVSAPLRDLLRNYSSPRAELCCTHNGSDRNDVTH